jgi:hypothetical protein
MSKNLQNCLKHFELISLIRNPRLRRGLLAELAINKCYYLALREMLNNSLKGNVKLNKRQKQKLNKYSSVISKINCKKKLCKKNRKQFMIQSGGFLPDLIPAVISTLIGK